MTGPTVKEEIKMPSTSTPTTKTFKAVARALGREIAQAKYCDESYQGIFNGVLGAVMDGFSSVAPRFDEALFRREFFDAVHAEQDSWKDCLGYDCEKVCAGKYVDPSGLCQCVQCTHWRQPADI